MHAQVTQQHGDRSSKLVMRFRLPSPALIAPVQVCGTISQSAGCTSQPSERLDGWRWLRTVSVAALSRQ
jgi:hypothetical protein